VPGTSQLWASIQERDALGDDLAPDYFTHIIQEGGSYGWQYAYFGPNVSKDNTVAIGDRTRQLEKNRFRSSLAGCMVTIHEHLDERISIRYGPHVVGRCTPEGNPVLKSKQQSRGKDHRFDDEGDG